MVDQSDNGAPGSGLGAIPSPPDDRDFPIEDLLASVQLAAAPAVYAIPGLASLPVLNQGISPMCVAYAHSALKAYEDHKDQGAYFNFNEPYFFGLIGGNANGAVIRYAMDRLLHYGYPVVGVGDPAAHKIAAYYRVPLDAATIKAAIMAFGPVTLGTHWFGSWVNPKSNGVLPAPSGSEGGHAIEIVGWDDARGWHLRNSWGTAWGIGGDCYMPFSYLLTYGFEVWKAVDVIEPPHGADVLVGHVVIIEGAYSMTGYVVGANCKLTPRKLAFAKTSSAPVVRGICGGRTYWKTTAGPLTGVSYVCGLTGYGWHISRRYRRSNGTIYDIRIACTSS